jgi:hypothetical protein
MMPKKTAARPSHKRLAKPAMPAATLSKAQLDQVAGGLNFTKITYNP